MKIQLYHEKENQKWHEIEITKNYKKEKNVDTTKQTRRGQLQQGINMVFPKYSQDTWINEQWIVQKDMCLSFRSFAYWKHMSGCSLSDYRGRRFQQVCLDNNLNKVYNRFYHPKKKVHMRWMLILSQFRNKNHLKHSIWDSGGIVYPCGIITSSVLLYTWR